MAADCTCHCACGVLCVPAVKMHPTSRLCFSTPPIDLRRCLSRTQAAAFVCPPPSSLSPSLSLCVLCARARVCAHVCAVCERVLVGVQQCVRVSVLVRVSAKNWKIVSCTVGLVRVQACHTYCMVRCTLVLERLSTRLGPTYACA